MSDTDSRALVLTVLKTHGQMTRKDLVAVCQRSYESVDRALTYYRRRAVIAPAPVPLIRPEKGNGRSACTWMLIPDEPEVDPAWLPQVL